MQRYIISFNYGAKQHTFFRIFTSSPSIYYPIVPIISKQILAKIKRIMAKIQLILAIIYLGLKKNIAIIDEIIAIIRTIIAIICF